LEDKPLLFGWYIFRGYVKLPGDIKITIGNIQNFFPVETFPSSGRGRPQCGIAETQGGLAVYMMFARRAAQHFKSKTSHLLTIKEEHVWKNSLAFWK